jgi:hypothetical protein
MAEGNSPVRKDCGVTQDHAHIHWVVTGNGTEQGVGGPNFFIPAPNGLHRAAIQSEPVNHQAGVYSKSPSFARRISRLSVPPLRIPARGLSVAGYGP